MARSASRQASSHAGSSGPVTSTWSTSRRDGERALRPPAAVAGRDDLDVVAGEQARDRARQRGVAVDHHPLDLPPELTGQQQPVGADHAVAGATPAGRLGEERPARLLGEDAGGRTGVVPGDDDRARAPARGRVAPRERQGWPPTVAAPRRRPPSPPSSGSSGSSSCTLRCTGRLPPWLRTKARVASRSAAATSSVGAKEPKIPTWSVVWLAPEPRRRAGRSAVTTTSGTPACAASTTAGRRLATAVPDVHDTAAGRLPTFASPRARKPAVRSSIRVCRRRPPAVAAS